MTTLNRDLRKVLETVSAKARTVAEDAAEKALNNLAVGDRKPHDSMTDKKQTALRNRLRAHGRQLGDARNPEKDTQAIDCLVAECAYEHWHRMLFARFLAENGFLVEPDSDAAVSIEEVKQLARSRGLDWMALAGEFAVHMLPQVFRQDNPVLEVRFAPEDRKRLEELLLSLPEAVFLAGDSLGWCYQFWQAERKDEINASGDKIGADELPAVTQLFTEDYMVDFLLDNTLGAWHAGKVLSANPRVAEDARSEDELRKAVALPGCQWEYLRFIKGEDDRWSPAAGTFDGWPRSTAAIMALDPCMGSGHFVVAMFERLVALRMFEEALEEEVAVAAVIRDNLFGLEIDPRCTQIGAFNLALAAWRRVGNCNLAAMNLACSGLAPNTREVDWTAIADGNEKLKNGMARLHRLFKDAPVLGSLISPRAAEGDLLEAGFHELQPLLEAALAQETNDAAAHEMAVTARGLTKAAEILARQFTLVATNVPYLKREKLEERLRDHCDRFFPSTKGDLATVFIERCAQLCQTGGAYATVAPQSWLYLQAFAVMRKEMLKAHSGRVVAKLGPGAFATIGGEVVNVALTIFTTESPSASTSMLFHDSTDAAGPLHKATALKTGPAELETQARLLGNPDSRIVIADRRGLPLLAQFADALEGLSTGDLNRTTRRFWELERVGREWEGFQGTVRETCSYGGRDTVLLWEGGSGPLAEIPGARIVGRAGWGHRGVAVSQMHRLGVTLFDGDKFDDGTAAIIPKKNEHLAAVWAFCSSPDFPRLVREIDESLKVTSKSLVKVPFDLPQWQKVAAERYPHGLPKPSSSDPTQWLFNGHPAGADQPLHVAVARLLGYQWPRQTGSSFSGCPALSPDGLETFADNDGIVPISPVKGEGLAAERLSELLASAYGEYWNATRLEEMLAHVEFGASLEHWLRNGFFEQHCALFQNRPFIWHVWDGLPDGFHALVNHHRLTAAHGDGRRTLDKLAFSYLGDWVTRQRAEQRAGTEGADAKVAAAVHLQDQLKSILAGEPPYDLFARWKPLRDQAIGWAPDVNDGVSINSRPFIVAKTLNGRSILRKALKPMRPKDRGKESERAKQDYPWFWSWDEKSDDFMGGRTFDGNRWNDLHYSNAVKEASRADSKGKKR